MLCCSAVAQLVSSHYLACTYSERSTISGASADRGPDFRPNVVPSPPNIQWFHPPALTGGFLGQLTSEARAFSLHGRRPNDANPRETEWGLGMCWERNAIDSRGPLGPTWAPANAVRSTHYPSSHVKIMITAEGVHSTITRCNDDPCLEEGPLRRHPIAWTGPISTPGIAPQVTSEQGAPACRSVLIANPSRLCGRGCAGCGGDLRPVFSNF